MFVFFSNSFRIVVDNSSTLFEVFQNYHDSEIDGVLFSSKQYVMYFNALSFPHRFLKFTKDQLFDGYNVYYFPKKSILRKLFNHRIQIFLESGLNEFWYMQGLFVHRSRRTPKESSELVLYFENILGILQICGTMYLITCIVFFLEMMTMTYTRVKDILDYFTY